MQFIKPAVQTICFGVAMSMGSLLLAGCAPGKRMALPNSAHPDPPAVGRLCQGQSTDIEIHARDILDLRDHRRRASTHVHRPERPTKSTRDMERDRFFTAEQALEYRLIDRVITSHELERTRTGFAAGADRAHA